MKPVILETRCMCTDIHAMTRGWQHCHLPPLLRTWALSYSPLPDALLYNLPNSSIPPQLTVLCQLCWIPHVNRLPTVRVPGSLHLPLPDSLSHLSALLTYLGINSSCCLPLTPPSPDVSALRSEVSKLLKWKEETKFIFRRVCGWVEISGLLKAEVIEGPILMVKQSTGCPISF